MAQKSTYRFGQRLFSSRFTRKGCDGIRIVQQAHRSVTWPCSMQIIWTLSTKRDKVHLHHIATQWEGGARQPWSGNGFTLTDKSGYTQGCPEGLHTPLPPFLHFCFHMYISTLLINKHLCRELVFVFLPAMHDVLRSLCFSAHMIKSLWLLPNDKTSTVHLPCKK